MRCTIFVGPDSNAITWAITDGKARKNIKGAGTPGKKGSIMTNPATSIIPVDPRQLSLFGLPQPLPPPPPTAPSAARPFLKWAGSKRKLVPALLPHFAANFGTYHEPFLGGGAMFFALRPASAVLSDVNERLVRTFVAIRDDVEAVIGLLATYPNEQEFFVQTRKVDIDSQSDAEVAAWFVYLNKTCFNGLYRVNASNRFNVPFGDNPTANVCDERNLRACSAALQGVDIRNDDFAKVLDRAQPGDVVYFDPPYVPASATSSFTAYSAGGFTAADQFRLRDVARELKVRGVHVVISNSDTPEVRGLYADGFTIATVEAARNINATVSGRGKVSELIIT